MQHAKGGALLWWRLSDAWQQVKESACVTEAFVLHNEKLSCFLFLFFSKAAAAAALAPFQVHVRANFSHAPSDK